MLAGKEIIADQQTLQVDITKDQIPGITKKLMDTGVNIYSVQITKQTLEDKFIEITGGIEK